MKQLIEFLLLFGILSSCSSGIENEASVRSYLEHEYSVLLQREQRGIIEIEEQVARIGNKPEDLKVLAIAEQILEKSNILFQKIEQGEDPNVYKEALLEFQVMCSELECEYTPPGIDSEKVFSSTHAKYMVLRLTQEAMQCLKRWVATTS